MKYKGIELVPKTEEQILDHDKEYAFWDEDMTAINVVYGGCIYNKKFGNGSTRLEHITKFGVRYENCAEIPQTTMRDRTGLEVIEYVHNLQKLLTGIPVPTGFKRPASFSDNICWIGTVVFDPKDGYGFTGIGSLTEKDPDDDNDEVTFGVLYDGKVTEFEIPQIEVKS